MTRIRHAETSRTLPLAWRGTLRWAPLTLYLVLVVGFAWNPTPFAQGLAAIAIAAALAHAIVTYGWKDALVFLALCLGISFTLENIGATTGFPFGSYHFVVGAGLPHIGVIPIIVGPLWFGMGYFSLMVAETLLGDTGQRRWVRIIGLPIVAAFVMTQWDLVMDPPESTISKAWIWHHGGADFGVPLSNYLGWLLTSWLFYQAFILYLSRKPAAQRPAGRRAHALVAILFYLSAGVTHVTALLVDGHGQISDAAGHLWLVHDLRETAVIVMLFTMGFTSLLALLQLGRREKTDGKLLFEVAETGERSK